MSILRLCGVVATGLLTTALLSPVPAEAAVRGPVVVNFTGESEGDKPSGYATAAAPGVLFFDTNGSNLQVYNSPFGETHGPALLSGGDNASAIEIRLSSPTQSIRLALGNDDPAVMDVTDQAQLTLFRGATQVGQVLKNVNANDLMDQKIGFSGKLFNRARFQFVDAAQTPLNIIEVIDDVKLSALCTITGSAGNNHLRGTPGRDVICGDAGADVIKGRGGDDLIYAGAGADRANGGGGDDKILGENGADTLAGSGGGDNVSGGQGKDKLSGGTGPDLLSGGTQRDTCNGGSETDRGPGCEVKIRIP